MPAANLCLSAHVPTYPLGHAGGAPVDARAQQAALLPPSPRRGEHACGRSEQRPYTQPKGTEGCYFGNPGLTRWVECSTMRKRLLQTIVRASREEELCRRP